MGAGLFTEKLDLSEFGSASIADWRAAAEAALKGKPLDKLTSKTPDGLAVEPIYQRDHATSLEGSSYDPGAFPYVRGARPAAGWETLEEGSDAPPRGWASVDASEIFEQGGSAVQEVAWAWEQGVQLLRGAEREGVAAGEAARKIRFTFAAGGEFFVGLAKLRAARFGWAQIVAACGGSAEDARMNIHSRTAAWDLSLLDPHTNILRATAAAYAAVLGGCDSLCVRAFDGIFREPDEFSKRLAVNTQRILREECHAGSVADPAGGSWYVESLTKEIAEAAWAEFQRLESGAALDASSSGGVQRSALSRRRRVIVGVNQYANPAEKPANVTRQTARLPEAFELLRGNAWAYAAVKGAAPKIFLLTMGPLKQHKARADFVRGFLEPGGFDVVYPAGFKTPDEAVAAAKASGALAAVLCSTDETYPELVPAAVAAAGPLPVILAGFPEGQTDAFKAAGIADFIHIKADCGAFLASWQKRLGVSK